MSEEEKKAIDERITNLAQEKKAIERITNLAQEKNANWLGLMNIDAMKIVLKTLEKYKNMYEAENRIHLERNRQIEDYEKWNNNAKAEITKLNNIIEGQEKENNELKKILDNKYIYTSGRTLYGRLSQLDKEDLIKAYLNLMNETKLCIKTQKKKNKLIDIMAKEFREMTIQLVILLGKSRDIVKTEKQIKQYFEEKVENGEE